MRRIDSLLLSTSITQNLFWTKECLLTIVFLVFYSQSIFSIDSIKIERLIDSADIIEATNRDSALLLYNQALEESTQLNNLVLIGRSYMNLGYYFMNEGKLDTTFILLNKAKKNYYAATDTLGRLKIHYAIAKYHSLSGDHKAAIEQNYIALQHASDLNAEEREIFILEAIGVCLERIEDYHESIKLYKEALTKSEEIRDTYSIASIRYNMSISYTQLDSIDFAIKNLKSSELLSEQKGFYHIHGQSLSNLADIYTKTEDFENLKIYLDKLELFLDSFEYNNLRMQFSLLNGVYHYKLKKYKKALEYGLDALSLHSKFKVATYEIKIHKLIADTYKALDMPIQAFEHLEKYHTLKDSIIFNERYEDIKKIQIQYETAQKDIEIKDQQITIQKQNLSNQLTLGATSLLGLLGAAMYLFLHQRARKNKIIAQREADLNAQRITQLEKEKQILSMSSMIEGQEAERTRIARDLHDGLGGLLSTIKLKFGIIQKEIAALESMNVYQQTSSMIDNACTEVRKIAHNMMPDSLIKLGLVEAIRDIAEYTSDININVINLGIYKMTETQEIMLYRVIQEFINNTRKHAHASNIIVQFSTDNIKSIIYLEDDGNGFNINNLNDDQGLGLKNMESRIQYINGTFELDSVLGVGTTVQINIPNNLS